jgi:hypothetical protein
MDPASYGAGYPLMLDRDEEVAMTSVGAAVCYTARRWNSFAGCPKARGQDLMGRFLRVVTAADEKATT